MELRFKSDTKFRKQFFTDSHFAHPAKMSAPLLLWIVDKYTWPGDVILDPMAGAGTTMLACLGGRNVVLVELEEKFVQMCRDNWAEVQKQPQMGYQMGWCEIRQGDARALEGVADCVISSPPYAENKSAITDKDWLREHQDELSMRSPSRHGAHQRENLHHERLIIPDNPFNIGNLPYGDIDCVVTSPPYAESVSANQGGERESHQEQRARRLEKAGYNPNDYQGGHGRNLQQDWTYGTAEGNIGNLPYGEIDTVITSPPYEGTLDARPEQSIEQYKEILQQRGVSPTAICKIATRGSLTRNLALYGESTQNIGNLKGDTYLEAMLQVYRQCFNVLKSNGLMILVTKNFIRDKAEVRLDEDTIKLCEQAGFTFFERHYRKLTQQSFWRTIYQQKYPDAPVIDKEDVLVFQGVKHGL